MSKLVERLAKLRGRITGHSVSFEADAARWWLNAIADELDAEGSGRRDFEYERAAEFLREQSEV